MTTIPKLGGFDETAVRGRISRAIRDAMIFEMQNRQDDCRQRLRLALGLCRVLLGEGDAEALDAVEAGLRRDLAGEEVQR